MGDFLRYCLLLAIKYASRLFYRFDVRWRGEPEPPWDDVKIVALLHHTSLYEWLYAGSAPNGLLRQIAERAFIPIADKTAARPVVGRFLTSLAPHHEAITREPDHTWTAVLERLDQDVEDVMVLILPEGRMMRGTGLDKHGRPMTVRGGIADILRGTHEGRMILVYLGGLHHVHIPGERRPPRLLKTLRIVFEQLDVEAYKNGLDARPDSPNFKASVRADLERRRDEYCPFESFERPAPSAADVADTADAADATNS